VAQLLVVVKPACRPVHYSPTYIGWRVDVPAGPIGRRRVSFRSKKKAELFLRAAKRELKKVRKVSFLTCPHRLLDGLEALKLLEKTDGPWWNKLRRAATLYALCCEDHEKRNGAGAKTYQAQQSRGIELDPWIFRGLDRIAREKGVDLGDLVAGLVWNFVRGESENLAKRHEYPREEKIRLRDVLYFEQGGRQAD
jgi:hypothetical protein